MRGDPDIGQERPQIHLSRGQTDQHLTDIRERLDPVPPDAASAAELGDRLAALVLALDLATPPFAAPLATCRGSESDHERSPGDETWSSGIEVTIRAKNGSAERLLIENPMRRSSLQTVIPQISMPYSFSFTLIFSTL